MYWNIICTGYNKSIYYGITFAVSNILLYTCTYTYKLIMRSTENKLKGVHSHISRNINYMI